MIKQIAKTAGKVAAQSVVDYVSFMQLGAAIGITAAGAAAAYKTATELNDALTALVGMGIEGTAKKIGKGFKALTGKNAKADKASEKAVKAIKEALAAGATIDHLMEGVDISVLDENFQDMGWAVNENAAQTN